MRRWVVGLAAFASIGCVRSFEARAASWWSVDTAHVRLQTDVDPGRAADTAWALEDLRGALERSFTDCPPSTGGERVEVVMLGHDDEYDEISPPRTGGFFDHGTSGTIAIPPRVVVRGSHTRGMAQIVTHELTHRFVAACFPDAPPWLHEGLATYFETLRVRADDVVVGLTPYHFSDAAHPFRYTIDGLDRFDVPRRFLPSATELVGTRATEFYASDGMEGERRTGRYAAAWALVHLFYLGPDAALRERFTTYLSRLRDARGDAGLAFRDAFAGVALDEVLATYLSRRDLHERHVPYAPAAIANPQPTAMSPGRAHLLWAQLYRSHDVVGDAARIEAHLAAAEASPDARARALLFRADYVPTAERDALITAAVDLAPDDLDVLRAGAVLAAQRPPGPEADAVVLAMTGRSDLRSVDRVALAALLLARGDLAGSAAEAAEAIALDPSSPEAHLAAASAATVLTEVETALRELRLVATLAAHHDPAMSARAETMRGRLLASLAAAPAAPGAGQAAPVSAPGDAPPTPEE